MSKILGIDQSFTSSGLVVIDKTSKDVVFCERFCSTKEFDIFERAWEVVNKIVQIANIYHPEIIIIEGLAFGGFGNSTRNLSGLQFMIISQLRFVHGFDVEVVAPTTVKKIASGSGGAKKKDVLANLPPEVLEYFKSLGYKKTKGLLDLNDAYWIAQSYFLSTTNTKYPKKQFS